MQVLLRDHSYAEPRATHKRESFLELKNKIILQSMIFQRILVNRIDMSQLELHNTCNALRGWRILSHVNYIKIIHKDEFGLSQCDNCKIPFILK